MQSAISTRPADSTQIASRAIALYRLSRTHFEFPPVSEALEEPNGLLAIGGDLSPERIERAYRSGIFPWFEAGGPILWWSPNPRALLMPGDLRISRSLRKRLEHGTFRVTIDTAFAAVVRACAAPREKADGTWITDDMIAAYERLHELGYAHSFESWQGDELVGGLYGVSWGAAFFGESMFARATDASKVAFCHLDALTISRGFAFIDCQVPNPHLRSLGVRDVPRATFVQMLANTQRESTWRGSWRDAPYELTMLRSSVTSP